MLNVVFMNDCWQVRWLTAFGVGGLMQRIQSGNLSYPCVASPTNSCLNNTCCSPVVPPEITPSQHLSQTAQTRDE